MKLGKVKIVMNKVGGTIFLSSKAELGGGDETQLKNLDTTTMFPDSLEMASFLIRASCQ